MNKYFKGIFWIGILLISLSSYNEDIRILLPLGFLIISIFLYYWIELIDNKFKES